MSQFICQTPSCALALSKASFPMAMNCPVCQTPLEEKSDTINLSPDDVALINSLPYVIAYPLKETLLQTDYEKRLHRLGYTFSNFLKYLGLISISEFFNSDIKNRRIVDLFLSQLSEPSFGKWNGFIRECYAELQKEKIDLIFPEFYNFYVQIENKDKKFNISEEIIEDFGEINFSKKNGLSSIGMLINFRNKYLGHGTPINENKAKELWEFYYPIFQALLVKLTQVTELSLYKRENGIVWKLASSLVTEEKNLNQTIDVDKVWLADNKDRKLSMLPFFIIPSDFGDLKNETQLLVYESYTGSTIKFFSPESIVKETSGKILERLKLLLREKQKETPFTPESFTKDEFLKRIAEENKLLLDTLITEKKIISGVYQHREEMEIKLREWIGARASIFFIVAEAGSGKTNLLAEIQKQYTERELPSLLIRAGRMEKQSLKEQITYLLNIDLQQGLENYPVISGTQSEPTFILIDGLNEANNAEEIWQEVIQLSKLFVPGSLKFVVTNRANTKAELSRYIVSENDFNLLYGENKDNETELGAYSIWMTPMDMKEMEGAWHVNVKQDKARFKPLFSFNDIAAFDRGLYLQINNPLVLRIFLETYQGKNLPKKGAKHLHIWKDWFATFDEKEQIFMCALADAIWEKGENEIQLEDLLNNANLKEYIQSDNISGPYHRLLNLGWISRFHKDLTLYVSFTLEGLLFYLLGLKLDRQETKITIQDINQLLAKGAKLHRTAVESFLKELANKGNLELISALIDLGKDKINICIDPLIIYLKSFGSRATIEKVLANPTQNDWEALLLLVNNLEKLEMYDFKSQVIEDIKPYNNLKTREAVLLGFKGYDYEAMLEYFHEQLEIIIKTEGEENLKVATLYHNIGKVYKGQCIYDKASYYFEKSLDINIKLLGERHPNVTHNFDSSGNLFYSVGDYDKAMDCFKKSLDIRLKTFGKEHIDVATSYNNIGKVYICRGDNGNALDCYKHSLNLLLKNQVSLYPLVANAYSKIASILLDKKEFKNAFGFYQKSLDIKLKNLGRVHILVAADYYNIGLAYNNKGEYDKALEFYEKALLIEIKTLGVEHPSVAITYGNIGVSWSNKGEYDKALEFYEKALLIEIKTLGVEHPDVATSYNNIGSIWNTKMEYVKALKFYENALHIEIKTLGQEHPDVAISYFNIGNCNFELKYYAEAIDFYKKGFSILNKGGFPFQIGKCYEVLDKKGLALDYFIQSSEIRKDDPEFGLDNERTKDSITNTKRLAKEIGKENELPEWMKEIN